MIELLGVCKSFGRDSLALWDISLTVPKGQFLVISGPPSSCKTTLLRVISGQLQPSDGRVLVDGVNVGGVRRAASRMLGSVIGVVPSRPLTLRDGTASRTVELALRWGGIYGAEAARRARLALEHVGLVHRSKSMASSLSEPERRRLSIARAVALDPKVLLADDPILALDNCPASEIMNILKRASDRGASVVMTTRADEIGGPVPPTVVRLSGGRIYQ